MATETFGRLPKAGVFPLTAGQLIERLSKMPPDTAVVAGNDEAFNVCPVRDVGIPEPADDAEVVWGTHDTPGDYPNVVVLWHD